MWNYVNFTRKRGRSFPSLLLLVCNIFKMVKLLYERISFTEFRSWVVRSPLIITSSQIALSGATKFWTLFCWSAHEVTVSGSHIASFILKWFELNLFSLIFLKMSLNVLTMSFSMKNIQKAVLYHNHTMLLLYENVKIARRKENYTVPYSDSVLMDMKH